MVVIMGVGATLAVVVLGGGKDRGGLLKPLTDRSTTPTDSAAAGAAFRGRGEKGVHWPVFLWLCPTAALLLESGIVGKEITRDLS